MVPQRFGAVALMLWTITGCATAPPMADGLALTVESYDPVSGAYVLELRNNTARRAVFLTNYLNFYADREHDGATRILRMIDDESLVHDAMLGAGDSVKFTGSCARDGACTGPNVYATAHACWLTDDINCDSYLTVWSDTPLNANRER